MRDRIDAWFLRRAIAVFERRGWVQIRGVPRDCLAHLRYRVRVLEKHLG